MMVESNTIQVLYGILLTIGARERWSAARSSFNGISSAGMWMITFAIVALIISVIFVVWAFIKRKHSENLLRQKVSELTITNKRLQREIVEFNNELLEVLQTITDVESPDKEVRELNAQQIHALSMLSQRLQQS